MLRMYMGVKKDKRTGNVVKGDDGKPIKVYNDVPMELLRLVRGQKAVGVNDPARMVKALSTPPDKMLETICKSVSHLAESEIIKVNGTPCKVNGKFLPPPKVVYGDCIEARQRSASWHVDNCRYVNTSINFKSWLIVDASACSSGNIDRVLKGEVRDALSRRGVQFLPNDDNIIVVAARKQGLRDFLRKILEAIEVRATHTRACASRGKS